MTTTTEHRTIRAPHGLEMTCKTWQAEGAMRMLMNNLDPEVAERPEALVVYGGRGQAARSWEAFDAIIESLRLVRPKSCACACQRRAQAIRSTNTLNPSAQATYSAHPPPAATGRARARCVRPRPTLAQSSTCAPRTWRKPCTHHEDGSAPNFASRRHAIGLAAPRAR